MGGRRVKPENARSWQGPWDRLPEEEVKRRQASIPNLKLPPMFETVTDRNRVIKRLLRTGTPASAIAKAMGLTKDRIYKLNRQPDKRGRFKPRKKKVEPLHDIDAIVRTIRRPDGPRTWEAAAKQLGRGTAYGVYDALRRRADGKTFEAIKRLMKWRRTRFVHLKRRHLADHLARLRVELGRPVTVRDLMASTGVGYTQLWYWFGKRGWRRACIMAGLDPLESRRNHFEKIGYRKPKPTREQ